MKIELFTLGKHHLPIRPCTVHRSWIEEHPGRNPYRCNPLTVANGYGWEIYSPSTFTAIWDGEMEQSDIGGISFRHKESNPRLPKHHFGNGILTWDPGIIIKTEFPYAMFISGPSNTIIKNATPLSGIIETYWMPFTFTLNWKINEPGFPVTINEGDVLAQIFPVQINIFDELTLEIKDIQEATEDFKTNFKNWTIDRDENLINYQGHYMKGTIPGTNYKEPNRYSKMNVSCPHISKEPKKC